MELPETRADDMTDPPSEYIPPRHRVPDETEFKQAIAVAMEQDKIEQANEVTVDTKTETKLIAPSQNELVRMQFVAAIEISAAHFIAYLKDLHKQLDDLERLTLDDCSHAKVNLEKHFEAAKRMSAHAGTLEDMIKEMRVSRAKIISARTQPE